MTDVKEPKIVALSLIFKGPRQMWPKHKNLQNSVCKAILYNTTITLAKEIVF